LGASELFGRDLMGGHVKQATYLAVCVISAMALGGVPAETEAQRRPAGQAQAKQAMQVSLTVGGQAYQSSEPGKCTHAPTAAIDRIVSQMWSIQQSADGRSVALTVWRPKDGSADMVTLSVTTGKASHRVNTSRGSDTAGSGKVTFEKSGDGGIFTLVAKTNDGTVITGRIKCDALAPHLAEGGL
jgi:hypothetical protein